MHGFPEPFQVALVGYPGESSGTHQFVQGTSVSVGFPQGLDVVMHLRSYQEREVYGVSAAEELGVSRIVREVGVEQLVVSGPALLPYCVTEHLCQNLSITEKMRSRTSSIVPMPSIS